MVKMADVLTKAPDLFTEDFDLAGNLNDLGLADDRNISAMNISGRLKGYAEEGPYLNDETPRYVFLVANLVIFVFGLLGNALVIYIIALFAKVRNKSVANYYIWNLAFADILCIAALPLFGYNTFTSHWPFGSVFCKIGYVLRDINKFTSVFTLVALSVDRYLATFHSMAYLRTIQVGKIICTVVWAISFIIATPYLLFAQTTVHPKGTISCRLIWPSSPDAIYMEFWTYFQLVVGLLLPFTIIIGSYVLLIRRFRKLVKLQAKSRIRRSGRKMTQTVIAVVLTFLFCQAPYHAVNIANIRMKERYGEEQTRPSQEAMRLYTYINGLAQVLVYISSCCNPVIYALLNENFRKLYALVLCQCRKGGNLNMDDIRNVELDGKYVPVSLRLKVQFHLPCKSSSRDDKADDHPRPLDGIDAELDLPPGSPLVNGGRGEVSLNSLEQPTEQSNSNVTTIQAVTAV
uniref:Orphan G-protein coupled receptor 26 n=1 Tax=Platynereis dumerilii TaxID=6359 RepID=A0A0K0PVP3_PLADU|nr:orphan G-protein coupled receptor 26 [Platynereis dumerilii]